MNGLNRLALGVMLAIPVLLLGLVTIHPYPVELRHALLRIRLAEAQGRFTDAAGFLRVVLKYQPDRLELWERIAENEFADHNYPAAIQDYEFARNQDVISIDGLNNLAEAYLSVDNIEKATIVWREMAQHQDISDEYFPHLVAQLRKYSDLDGALMAASAWREAAWRDGQAGLTYGLLLSYRDPEEALQVLMGVSNLRGIESRPADRLIEVLDSAIQSPDRAYSKLIIGQRLGDIGEWDLAEQSFILATQFEPEYAEAWAFLAEASQNLGKDGYPALRRAAELNPASDIVRIIQALYWRRQNEPEVALSYLRALADKYPEDGGWQIEIGATLAESSDLIEAMHSYQTAIEIEPENPSMWRALAIFSANYGFDEQSYTLPAVGRALELDPDGVENLDMAGWVYYTLGDLEKAEQFLQQALQVDGSYPPALLHIGQVYLETGRSSQAYRSLSRAASQTTDLNIAFLAERLIASHFQETP
jgi:tetratricopeptide (TPR) repeat protein